MSGIFFVYLMFQNYTCWGVGGCKLMIRVTVIRGIVFPSECLTVVCTQMFVPFCLNGSKHSSLAVETYSSDLPIILMPDVFASSARVLHHELCVVVIHFTAQ